MEVAIEESSSSPQKKPIHSIKPGDILFVPRYHGIEDRKVVALTRAWDLEEFGHSKPRRVMIVLQIGRSTNNSHHLFDVWKINDTQAEVEVLGKYDGMKVSFTSTK